MRHRDMRNIVIILYVLTLLFLGVIYMQGSLISDPVAMATLQNASQAANESMSITSQPLVNIQISGDSGWALFITVTAFFGLVWRIARPGQA